MRDRMRSRARKVSSKQNWNQSSICYLAGSQRSSKVCSQRTAWRSQHQMSSNTHRESRGMACSTHPSSSSSNMTDSRHGRVLGMVLVRQSHVAEAEGKAGPAEGVVQGLWVLAHTCLCPILVPTTWVAAHSRAMEQDPTVQPCSCRVSLTDSCQSAFHISAVHCCSVFKLRDQTVLRQQCDAGCLAEPWPLSDSSLVRAERGV